MRASTLFLLLVLAVSIEADDTSNSGSIGGSVAGGIFICMLIAGIYIGCKCRNNSGGETKVLIVQQEKSSDCF